MHVTTTGARSGWSWLVDGDDLEMPTTSVRVRYQPVARWRTAVELRPDRHGSIRVRRGVAARRLPAADYVTDSIEHALRAIPGFRMAVGASYSGDTRSFVHADALRLESDRVLTAESDIDLLVTGAIAWAEHLRTLRLIRPRPLP